MNEYGMTRSMYTEAVKLLSDANPNLTSSELLTMLEDVNSPEVRKINEHLYDEIIEKNHIDFDDIPVSKGDLKVYKGYPTMRESLDIIKAIALEHKSPVISHVTTVSNAMDHIISLKSVFKRGFTEKNNMVILEYNTYVYTCVQAVTSLMFYFVDYIKRPDQQVMTGTLKNTKYRPDLFYVEQLEKFNAVNRSGNYEKFLLGILNNGKENFIGMSTVVGAATLTAIALSIIPITREIIFQIYNTRRKISDCLALQAHLIEMNKLCIEGNGDINAQKKASILKKQEKIKLAMMRISDILKVDYANASEKTKRELKSKNTLLSIDNIQKEVSDSPLQLL